MSGNCDRTIERLIDAFSPSAEEAMTEPARERDVAEDLRELIERYPSNRWYREAAAEITRLRELLEATTPPPGDVVERVARAIDPATWEQIDRWRKAAKCYRDTPLAKGGWATEDDRNQLARDCDRKADKNAEASLKRATAALDAFAVERERMREALLGVREWLSGWASAEPYITAIDAALKEHP